VGCGPGMQTLDLAGLTRGSITAVDTHQPFLDRLQETVVQRNLTDRIIALNLDMLSIDFAPGSFDLIWAEGSIYIMGFERALQAWRPLLRNPGYLAASHISWLRPDLPDDLMAFWDEAYPDIQNIETNLNIIRKCGYDPIGHFALPESDWWDYYLPIQQKLPALKDKYQDNADALAVVQMEENEIELYRRYSSYYGYVFYLMQAR
ncbi:MAG: class I SAM-dependent methyltransferase, partial [Chloroflexota bacterium]|nr:class I SAM-dependent methyltransferase [Chloroflexota bacterium]